VLTEWDSELHGVSVHLRTITRDGWVATACLPSTEHAGKEGELYDLTEDPLQRANRMDDPATRSTRDDLRDDLWSALRRREPAPPIDAPSDPVYPNRRRSVQDLHTSSTGSTDVSMRGGGRTS